jgi:hypothetical protein
VEPYIRKHSHRHPLEICPRPVNLEMPEGKITLLPTIISIWEAAARVDTRQIFGALTGVILKLKGEEIRFWNCLIQESPAQALILSNSRVKSTRLPLPEALRVLRWTKAACLTGTYRQSPPGAIPSCSSNLGK